MEDQNELESASFERGMRELQEAERMTRFVRAALLVFAIAGVLAAIVTVVVS
jgi:hypothetical protein